VGWSTLASAAEPAGPKPPTALDAATRARVLDRLYQEVGDHYVEPDTARMIVEGVRGRQNAGAYDGLTDPVRFAEAVTRDLRSVNHDLHLSLRFNPTGGPGAGGPGGAPKGGQPTQDDEGIDEACHTRPFSSPWAVSRDVSCGVSSPDRAAFAP